MTTEIERTRPKRRRGRRGWGEGTGRRRGMVKMRGLSPSPPHPTLPYPIQKYRHPRSTTPPPTPPRTPCYPISNLAGSLMRENSVGGGVTGRDAGGGVGRGDGGGGGGGGAFGRSTSATRPKSASLASISPGCLDPENDGTTGGGGGVVWDGRCQGVGRREGNGGTEGIHGARGRRGKAGRRGMTRWRGRRDPRGRDGRC